MFLKIPQQDETIYAGWGSSIKKAEAVKKLGWEYNWDYFIGFAPAKTRFVVDLLFEQLAEGFREIQRIDNERYVYILHLIQRTIQAEFFAEGACTAEGIFWKASARQGQMSCILGFQMRNGQGSILPAILPSSSVREAKM